MTESSARHRQPTNVRLVVADVDGTLVTPDKIVTPRARAAVRQVMKADIAFTITSGRPPRGMKALIDDLQVRCPIAAFNGGLFVQPDLSVLRRHVISREAATSVIDVMTRGGLDVWLYTDNDWYVKSRHSDYRGHAERRAHVCARSGMSIAMAKRERGCPACRHVCDVG